MIPRATYRLQFHKDFDFDEAAWVAPYLSRLGVSHVYASPLFKARPGSQHGYDVVDHTALNPELGGEAAFARMRTAFEANGLRLILDLVPNHMSVGGADNPIWLNVLEWGRKAQYAGWFDIDWEAASSFTRDKLLVPFLQDQYGVALERGNLTLQWDGAAGTFAVWAYDTHKLPICPYHYGRILSHTHESLEGLADAFANLPEWGPDRERRVADLKTQLAAKVGERGELQQALATTVARFNGRPGDAASWGKLNALIRDQHWRVAHYRVAADDINYRRFFDINDLAGLRQELPEVFQYTHAFALELLRTGAIDGLRIDHLDGLLDPKGYLTMLREALRSSTEGNPYLVVEKILAHHEALPEDWPVHGTTGYDFGNFTLGLLIDRAGETELTRIYQEFTGEQDGFPQIVRSSKLRIMEHEMTSELNMLARDAARIAQQNPTTADFTHNILRRAIKEIIASFPVYRTYMDESGSLTEWDRRNLEWALAQARTQASEIDPSVFDFLFQVLSGELASKPYSGFSGQKVLRFAMKLQQYSGPVMAKGLEDTAFYRYNRFVALNEVGGHPDQFGVTPAAFHKANANRARQWPHAMLSTATHDTKRGEDVRARLAVLSESPEEWGRQVNAWSRVIRARRGDIERLAPPHRNDEYLFYQLLVGSWPAELTLPNELNCKSLSAYKERLKGAMIKSIREAKVFSTWASPKCDYEKAVLAFVDDALDPKRAASFLSLFLPFQERVARLGVRNSLVQTVLKLTSPGVPDIYQGTELWDLSLMDPDNRRAVDYTIRSKMLETLIRSEPLTHLQECMEHWHDGAIKLAITAKLLSLREHYADLFSEGGYEPVATQGSGAEQICAFHRSNSRGCIVVAITRLPATLERMERWEDTTVSHPPQCQATRWREVLTGRARPVNGNGWPAEYLFAHLPVAVLVAA